MCLCLQLISPIETGVRIHKISGGERALHIRWWLNAAAAYSLIKKTPFSIAQCSVVCYAVKYLSETVAVSCARELNVLYRSQCVH